MPPWEYTDIQPNVVPWCPWCHKGEAVKPHVTKKDTYTCGDCGTAFVAKWRPA